MVSMKEITMIDNIISLTCYAENDKSKCFKLKIDSCDFHIVENTLGAMNIYSRMAVNKIRNTLAEENSLPTELCSYWC